MTLKMIVLVFNDDERFTVVVSACINTSEHAQFAI